MRMARNSLFIIGVGQSKAECKLPGKSRREEAWQVNCMSLYINEYIYMYVELKGVVRPQEGLASFTVLILLTSFCFSLFQAVM